MSYQLHNFTLRQLQYALAVAETLHFGKAAQLCHVSQPSLSIQLAELEEALGIKIFERDKRNVLITEAGKVILERAARIAREFDGMAEQGRLRSDPLAGTLHIGVIPTISPYLLPRLSSGLHRDFPKLKVLWTEDKTEVLLEKLKAGKLDAALLAMEADVGEVASREIAFDPFVLATCKGHPLSKKKSPLRLSELNEAEVLLLDDGHCFREQALAVCKNANAHELEFRATSLSTLAQMVANGAGVTLLPQMAVAVEAARAELHVRQLAKPVPGRTIALVWRPASAIATSLQKLAERFQTLSESRARSL